MAYSALATAVYHWIPWSLIWQYQHRHYKHELWSRTTLVKALLFQILVVTWGKLLNLYYLSICKMKMLIAHHMIVVTVIRIHMQLRLVHGMKKKAL